MTKKTYVFFILLSFLFPFGCSLTAQHQITYAPLRCMGDIPKDFLQLSSEKVDNDKKKIAKTDLSRKERKLEREFALNSNFGVDEILFSGKVLYGDPLSVYINKVADKVLENNKELREELRFYVLKISSVNAFSTSQGIIFVSIGLISQVENEAQLAFVLCHEISHYIKRHSIESYKRNMDIIKGRGKFKQLNFEERLKDMYSYSKENEIEADREGLALYLKTPYYTSAILSSFDMLLYSYLPYDEVEWSPKEFQDSFYKFPLDYMPKKAKEISATEDENDEESTHPNIKKRKSEIESLLERKNPPKGSAFYLLGQEYFSLIQQQSRIELFFILINNAQYEKAYYLSFLYKYNYNDTAYTSKIAAYCIYAKAAKELSSKKESNSLESEAEKPKLKPEGEFYNVAFFFDKLDKEELAVLSVRMTWDAHCRNSNDTFYKVLFSESVKNLFKYTDYTINNFYQVIDTAKTIDSSESAETTNNDQKLSKVDKLKKKKKKQVTTDLKDTESGKHETYLRYAFIKFFKNEFFRKTIEEAASTYQDKDNDESEISYNYRKIKRWHKRYGYAGNIDSLILVNPFFTKIYLGRKGPQRDLLFNEQQELKLAEIYVKMARKNNIAVQPLNLLDKEILNTEKFNQYAQIMEWLTERLDHFSSDVKLFNTQFVSEVVRDMGTSKLCLGGISYLEETREFEPQSLYSVFFPPILALYIIYQQSHTHKINLTTIIFDLNTGKLEFLTSDEIRVKYKKTDYMNSQIYSIFNQISRKVK